MTRISATAIDNTINRVSDIVCAQNCTTCQTKAISSALTWAVYRGRLCTEGLVTMINLSKQRLTTMVKRMAKAADKDGSTENVYAAMKTYLGIKTAE